MHVPDFHLDTESLTGQTVVLPTTTAAAREAVNQSWVLVGGQISNLHC